LGIGKVDGNKPGNWETRIAEAFARQQLVARGVCGGGRMPRQAEPLGDTRADHGRAIADDEEAVERTDGGRRQNRGDRSVLVVNRIGIAWSCQGSSIR